MNRIRVVYQVASRPAEIENRAREIALEQTVEVPEALVTPAIESRVVARVEQVEPLARERDRFAVTLSFAADLAAFQIPQLLNLVYGNVSIQPDVRLQRLDLPEVFLRRFPGPRYGIAGLRERLDVFHRPLLATALKPRGSSAEDLARIAGEFARGGGDLVKDDHNLVDASFEDFMNRVLRCRDAVRDANAATGGKTLYLPCFAPPFEDLDRTVEFIQREHIPGILLAPFLLGLDVTRSLLERNDLIALAHPAFSGPYYQDPHHGVTHEVLLGTLMRLIGCDASVFPNHGGRFSFSREECQAICDNLTAPLGNLAPAFPCPAGGMRFERMEEMAREFGKDAIFLIGGALLGDSKDLEESTRGFVEEIERIFA